MHKSNCRGASSTPSTRRGHPTHWLICALAEARQDEIVRSRAQVLAADARGLVRDERVVFDLDVVQEGRGAGFGRVADVNDSGKPSSLR